MKKIKTLLPAAVALVLTILLFLIFFADSNIITRRSTDDFITDSNGFYYETEQVAVGSFFTNIQGFCFNTSGLEEYYNFGTDMRGNAVYSHLSLCLVKDDSVYILPTVQQVREDILALPQAEAIKETPSYNFYAGTQSRFITAFIPDGSYKTGFIYTDINGLEYLLICDRELVK